MQSVVDHPQGLSAQWLSEALHAAGHPFTVSDVRFERVGTGQMGTTYRLDLSYVGVEGPPTLIAKLAGEDEGMRSMVAPGYAAEVGFYSKLAPGLNIRTPRCWYGAITDDHTRFTLLLDDMFPTKPGIQAEGCTVEQAAALVRTYHAISASGRRTGSRARRGRRRDKLTRALSRSTSAKEESSQEMDR